jgi:hypothetical protein
MNHVEWSQTANISYRSLGKADQESIALALDSLSPERLLAESNKVGGNLYVFRIPPYLRVLLKRERNESLRLVDILDRRIVESFLGKHIA